MSTTIFPQNGDNADEEFFSKQLARPAAFSNHVISGGKVTAATGLDVDVPAVEGYINGTYIDVTSTVTLTLTDDETNYIFLGLTRSGGKVQSPASDADNYSVTTSADSSPSSQGVDQLLIARVVTTSGSVSDVYDLRWMHPGFTHRRRIWDFIQVASNTTLARQGGLQVPVLRRIDGRFIDQHIRAELQIDAPSSGGFKVGFETLELPGAPNLWWRLIDSGGTLTDSGTFRTNATSATFYSNAAAFDGVFILGGSINLPDAATPFWITFAQNTSNATNSEIQRGSYVEVRRNRRHVAQDNTLV